MRILYIEDEKFLAEAVIHLLKKSKIMVDWTGNGNEGLELAMKPSYDCIVLDIMLPGLNGLEILRTLRARNINTPIIMLSALNEVEDKIKGLEDGADDYLAKPFKTAELIARINAVPRRPELPEKKVLQFGDIKYDQDNRMLCDEPLTDKEAEIFEMLIRNTDVVVTKKQILTHVWGMDAEFDDNYAEVYISYLRKKLSKLSHSVKIKTIRSLGYRLIEE